MKVDGASGQGSVVAKKEFKPEFKKAPEHIEISKELPKEKNGSETKSDSKVSVEA